MLIYSLCPNCQYEHELSDALLGDTVNCQKCRNPFVVVQMVKEEEQLTISSLFEGDQQLKGAESRSSEERPAPRKLAIVKGRHSLAIPPPPQESWSAECEEEKKERFREFRHDSRAMNEFLERREGTDYGGLLFAGLLLTTLIVFSLLGLFIFLMVRWIMLP